MICCSPDPVDEGAAQDAVHPVRTADGGGPRGSPDAADSIRRAGRSPSSPLPVVTVSLGEFPYGTALRYLEASGIAAGLRDELQEKQKLAHLTRGHPLWLGSPVTT